MANLPILIIGAGPIGLAAAAKCVARGDDFLLLEAGRHPAAAVRQWGHVRLFSPWEECVDADAEALIAAEGWRGPDPDLFPTGARLAADYLDPIASHPAIRDRLRLNCRITGCARQGMDKTRRVGRFDAPFVAVSASGASFLGRAVLDASGTWYRKRHLRGSRAGAAGGKILSFVPNLGRERVKRLLSGKRVMVVGSGHSGMTAIIELAERREPGAPAILWVRRSERPSPLVGTIGSGRRALEARAEAVARGDSVETLAGVSVTSLTEGPDGVTAVGVDCGGNPVGIDADVAILLTGFRPDLSFASDLWLAVDHRWEASAGLADLVDPDRHGCGSVPRHGVAELAHPERDFFTVGAKSYGRAPNFALPTGYGQLDSILDQLSNGAKPSGAGPRPLMVGGARRPGGLACS